MKTLRFADLKHKASPARRAEIARAAKTMHNPPHPGEFITAMYLEPDGISGRQLAVKLSVAPSTLNRILLGTSAVKSGDGPASGEDARQVFIPRRPIPCAVIHSRPSSQEPNCASLSAQ